MVIRNVSNARLRFDWNYVYYMTCFAQKFNSLTKNVKFELIFGLSFF